MESRLAAHALCDLLAALVRSTPRDMSLTALATLSTLDRTGSRRVTELAVIEGVAQPSMTSLVGNLERDGLVARHSDPDDKRACLVSITEKGTAYLSRLRLQSAESIERLIDMLPASEASAIFAAVDGLLHLRQLEEDERDPARSAS